MPAHCSQTESRYYLIKRTLQALILLQSIVAATRKKAAALINTITSMKDTIIIMNMNITITGMTMDMVTHMAF